MSEPDHAVTTVATVTAEDAAPPAASSSEDIQVGSSSHAGASTDSGSDPSANSDGTGGSDGTSGSDGSDDDRGAVLLPLGGASSAWHGLAAFGAVVGGVGLLMAGHTGGEGAVAGASASHRPDLLPEQPHQPQIPDPQVSQPHVSQPNDTQPQDPQTSHHPDPVSTTVSGTVMAGPVQPGAALQVRVLGSNGSELIAPVAVADDGSFRFTVADYTGPVVLRLVDTNGAAADYRDEATGALKDIADLSAVTVLNGAGEQTVALTPITTLSTLLLGTNTPSAEQVTQANQADAHWFGLSNVLDLPHAVIHADGTPAPGADLSGEILAVMSASEQAAGLDSGSFLNVLARGIPSPTSGQPASQAANTHAVDLLLDGLDQAALTQLDGPSAEALVHQWTGLPIHLGDMKQTTVNDQQTFTLTLAGDFKAGEQVIIRQDGVERPDLMVPVTHDCAGLRVVVHGNSLGMGDGTREFSAEVHRPDGGLNQSNPLGIFYDGPPDAPVLSLLNDTGRSASDLVTEDATLHIDHLEAGATWAYSVDGGQNWLPGQGHEIPATAFTQEGHQHVLVHQTDTAGNVATAVPLDFTLDRTASTPTATLLHDTGVSAADGITSDATLVIGGLEPGANWSYRIGSAINYEPGIGSEIPDSAFLLDGTYSVTISQHDVAGNVAEQMITIIVDRSTPLSALDLNHHTGALPTLPSVAPAAPEPAAQDLTSLLQDFATSHSQPSATPFTAPEPTATDFHALELLNTLPTALLMSATDPHPVVHSAVL